MAIYDGIHASFSCTNKATLPSAGSAGMKHVRKFWGEESRLKRALEAAVKSTRSRVHALVLAADGHGVCIYMQNVSLVYPRKIPQQQVQAARRAQVVLW